MKNLINQTIKESVKEISQDEKRYKLDLDERITPYRNHKLYKVDLNNGKILKAEYSSDLVWCPNRCKFIPENPTLIKEKGYKYVSALNVKNVRKKLTKKTNGSRINHEKDKLKL